MTALVRDSSQWFLVSCVVGLLLPLVDGMCQARTWRIPQDAPTIQAGIDAATVGDDILVSPGTYFEHDIDVGIGLWIHSRDGAATTVIDGEELDSVFDVRGVTSSCTIEGFTLQNGRQIGAGTGGGAIRGLNSTLVVSNCIIQDCYGAEAAGGILGLSCFVRIENCDFARNEGGGGGAVVVSGRSTSIVDLTIVDCRFGVNVASGGTGGAVASSFATVLIEDCVFLENQEVYSGGAALVFYEVIGEVRNCTFVKNRSYSGEGSVVRLAGITTVRMEQSILAFNTGVCVETDYPQGFTIGCSDLFGNSGGNDYPGTDAGGNFSADPLFCDPDADDYSLDADSPCLPGQHPDAADCGLIGAIGKGCGASTPILETTWGSIKAVYR